VTEGAFERADLLERIGESETVSGRHEAAEQHLREAVAEWRSTPNRERTARATASLASALLNAYHADRALSLLQAAAEEFSDLPATEAHTAILGQLARTHFLQADMQAAIEMSDRVLESAEHANMIELVADTLVTKGSALVAIGRVREGRALLSGGLETAQRHRLTAVATRAFINSSFTAAMHDPREALAVGRTGLEFANRIGRRSDAAVILTNAAFAAVRVGEWDWIARGVSDVLVPDMDATDRAVLLEAVVVTGALRGEPIEAAMAELELALQGSTDVQLRATAYNLRAYIAFAGGHFNEAVSAWRTAGELSPGTVANALAMAGHAALLGGDLDAARALRAAFEATGIHGPAPDADRLALDAGITALAGSADEAFALYREAARSYQDLGLIWDEALAGLEMASVLGIESEAIRTVAAQARATLEGLGAMPMVALLDGALSRPARPVSPTPQQPVETPAR
jgi:tetratricopeptide (TPR) repeat protein